MLDNKTVFAQIYTGLDESVKTYGFAPVFPKGKPKNETPIIERESGQILEYAGEKGSLRVTMGNGKIYLLAAEPDNDSPDDSGYDRLSVCLLDMEEYTEKDVAYIINEFTESVTEKFGEKGYKLRNASGKGIIPVSRSAAKSGAMSYDPNTLANRLIGVYPELKDCYRQNIDSYGDFLPEDFFISHANNCIIHTLRENNAQKVKKLFNILGEIYEDGTNEVQSLIVVTIFGAAGSDAKLFKVILDNIGDSMLEPVVEVNKILSKSKSANMRLENPPLYKPKKEKKPGLMASLMGGGQQPRS